MENSTSLKKKSVAPRWFPCLWIKVVLSNNLERINSAALTDERARSPFNFLSPSFQNKVLSLIKITLCLSIRTDPEIFKEIFSKTVIFVLLAWFPKRMHGDVQGTASL
jgi:hypothetical protein